MKQITINVSDNDYMALENLTRDYSATRAEKGTVHTPNATPEAVAELVFHRGIAH